ncbi:MAG TPA: DHA2 family efflux MFS transporter permease subunit [Longimicrobiales bacterium]|nr:DHA2 family efflux MFS transporter permease subunit [Longimicrobiales bacterium]
MSRPVEAMGHPAAGGRATGGIAHPAAGADPYAHKWLVAVGVTLGSVIELIDTSIVNVALAPMSANLGVTIDEITWVTVGYILASVIILPMTGWFASYFGRKRYFVGSIIIFTVASFFCGTARSLTTLVVWRIVQGIGGGALISTAQAILFDAFPYEERTLAAAIFGIGMMVGPAIGPTLGGVIVDRYDWPWIFFINLPVGLLATLLVGAYVHDRGPARRPGKIDVAGFALLAIGIGSLQFVLERGEHYDWFDSPLIFFLTATAVVALLVMIWWELRVPEPVLNLRVLKDRSLWSGSLAGAALGMGLFGSIFALPIFAQQLLRLDAETTGWLLFPGAVGSATAMVFIARMNRKIDGRLFIVVGALILSYSMFQHAHFTLQTSRAQMLWPVALRGFGTGMMFVPLTTAAMAGLHGRDLGQGAAIFNLSRQLGGSLGIAALATLMTRYGVVYGARLSESVSALDPMVQQRLQMMTRGFMAQSPDSATAAQRALATLARMVQAQAMTLTFEQIFRLVGIIILITIPLTFLLKRPAAGGGMNAH